MGGVTTSGSTATFDYVGRCALVGLVLGAAVGLTSAVATVWFGADGWTQGTLLFGMFVGSVVGLVITAVALPLALVAGRRAPRGGGRVDAVHLVAALVLAVVALVISSRLFSLPPPASALTVVLGGAEVVAALLLTRSWRTTALRLHR